MKGLPTTLASYLKDSLGAEMTGFEFIGGGCINHAGQLQTTRGSFFLKWNDVTKFPDIFKKESQSLQLLSKSRTVKIPDVLDEGVIENECFLLLEYLPKSTATKTSWERLGQELATMHRFSEQAFGLDFDNYIGALPQSNQRYENWADFFREARLKPQVALGIEKGIISQEIVKEFEALYKKLPDLIPSVEKPSLLHGDLWSGNVLMTLDDTPCLVDPATYYGHREAEIAFTKLFGGFDPTFYASYQEHHPLEPGFEKRTDIFNLYPLLVHVNLFGAGYLEQVKLILKKYL